MSTVQSTVDHDQRARAFRNLRIAVEHLVTPAPLAAILLSLLDSLDLARIVIDERGADVLTDPTLARLEVLAFEAASLRGPLDEFRRQLDRIAPSGVGEQLTLFR